MTACATCRFRHYVWREGDEYTHVPDYDAPSQQKRFSDFVQCRRSPPVVVGDYTNGIEMLWPTVQPDDWCGEYLKPKTPPPPPYKTGEPK